MKQISVPATLHAFGSVSFSATALIKQFREIYLWENKQRFPILDYGVAHTFGYFLEDTLLLLPYFNDKSIGGVPMVLHHFLCLTYTFSFLVCY